ncbi:uncharacterized protein LOC115963201 [Quercus lobata]|nr:uncharacterized protein LOC115963201 [Quercus lobata]XP_030937989.1 uncharacterized protein LOC115963201 [Quercus lobata]
MHCGLHMTKTDTQKVSEEGKDSLSRKFQQELGFSTSLEDRGVFSIARCPILTFLTLESDGHWRIFAVPLRCPDHTNHMGSGVQVNMDSLHMVSPPSISSYRDRQNVWKGPPADGTYSVDSYTTRSFPGSNVQRQSRNKALTNKATKLNELSNNSSHQNSFICSNSPGLNRNGSKANSSSDLPIDSSQLDKAVKRNSRKKARKKKKQSMKLLSDSGSTELEVLSEEYAHGSPTSETCGNTDLGHRDGPLSSDNLFQTKDSIFDGVEHTHCVQISCYDDMYSKGLSDMHDSLVLDSVSVGSNSDDNIHAVHDVQQSENESFGISVSEPPGFNSSKECLSHQSSLNCVVDTKDHTERKKCGSQVGSCSDMQVVLPGKRGRQNKTSPTSSSVHRFGSVRNMHGRTGKENNHSIWQKVQRNEASGCNGEMKKVSPVCSQIDVTLKEAPLLKGISNDDVTLLSKSVDKKHLKGKISRKLKRKDIPATKQDYGYSRKGSQIDKASSNCCPKIIMQQNEIKDFSSWLNDQTGLSCASRSCSQSNRAENMTSESVYSTQVHPDELEPPECNTVSSTDNCTTGNQESSLPKSCDSDQSNLLEVKFPVYLPHLLVNEVGPVQKEISLAEYNKPSHGIGSISQRWIPIGMKDPGFTSSARSDCSSMDYSDVPAAELKNTVERKTASSSQNLVSSLNGVMCRGKNSGDLSSHEDEGHTQKLGSQDACTLKEHNNKHVAGNCFTVESKDQHAFETNSYKIAQAVNNSCRAQLASEAVQMATGSPIAEIERLLHFSSPVVCQSSSLIGCQTCLRDQVGGVSLCRHEIPNVPLRCLWQWYERHGSYGLEIRAEDHENMKRLGVDCFAFCAYFVPYLSAVQLFRNHKNHPIDTSKKKPCIDVQEACETSETLEKPSIFSVLFPRPRTKDTGDLLLVNQVHGSEQSPASDEDDDTVQSVDMTCSRDLEPLFEYFESEQPQQRLPLYEKIRELVRGDGPSHCKVYGDSTKLDSINLQDLHPSSWYSVAWYPIYRIPDGNFHAAFLTYHSLGHLVRRSAKFDKPSPDACIVSPVVGLQSYSAQGECWFRLRQSVLRQTAETAGLKPFGILKERLRTLEETASLMARAVVNKGNMTSINRHPDYEFFLSRRR